MTFEAWDADHPEYVAHAQYGICDQCAEYELQVVENSNAYCDARQCDEGARLEQLGDDRVEVERRKGHPT